VLSSVAKKKKKAPEKKVAAWQALDPATSEPEGRQRESRDHG